MPVEAMAAGAPVVCHEVGGARESLAAAGVGAAVDIDDDEALGAALRQVLDAGHRVPAGAMAPFSRARFVGDIRAFVARHTSA